MESAIQLPAQQSGPLNIKADEN